ncbi:MAG: rRNA maturation RNase YbeY [Deltaproteobacteria bacterium]|nr:rRNA maturation RNase YbeY [Deltaproteobacteria bacterium]RLB18001.1 MAG: rRNA maturation RNase YbeY [Deltaproteobacteria bacterium]RLB20194.1 MAG: rRNA maturation RNase YbeY [Deltaproteobacteria bacterium]HDH86456.1 rRNA maturation RNase YbeY [Desulfobacteraceae bacterium]
MKLKRILKDLECHNAELSILITDDKHMAELNSRFLKRNGPTNVLAFPVKDDNPDEPETSMLGDIVISLDAAMRDAIKAGESLTKMIDRLLIHGLLHLLGYNHERSEEAWKMEEETERLLTLI